MNINQIVQAQEKSHFKPEIVKHVAYLTSVCHLPYKCVSIAVTKSIRIAQQTTYTNIQFLTQK